jgi:Leucine-rich repeat (LRR) protein
MPPEELLCLYANQLITLPPEVGHLSSLQELYLERNQLSTLPAEIGKHFDLQWLDILTWESIGAAKAAVAVFQTDTAEKRFSDSCR